MSPRYLILLAGLVGVCVAAEASNQPVSVDMRNVDLHIASGISLHVAHLRGRFDSTGPRPAPYLNDKRSYSVSIDDGEIALDLASLNKMMARSMGGEKSNVKRLQVWFNEDGTLGQKGVIDSAINVPFSARATLSPTADGRIRVSMKSIRGAGVPVSPVMKLFGLKLDNLVKMGSGVVADGNDLIIDPGRLIAAPSIRGRLTAVRIVGNRLVQTFGSGSGKPAVSGLSANHIYWHGSALSFGKLTMSDTDLELVDLDPADPFDFSVDDWNAQLVAGYSKTQPNRGLKAHMPDYNDLGSARGATKTAAGSRP
jgi:hypothetical protein